MFWSSKGKARADLHDEPANEPFREWRMSMAALLSEAEELKPDNRTHQKCLLRLQKMDESPLIRFLANHLALLDPVYQRLDPSPSPELPVDVHCMPCTRQIASAYTDQGIVICENHTFNDAHFKETLAHEMLREWDIRRFKVDGHNLRHHACLEIRANALSGDCRFGREMTRKLGKDEWSISKGHPVQSLHSDQSARLDNAQLCVRRQAINAVAMNPNCRSREEAQAVVEDVFESCYGDTRPFDEVYIGP